MKESNNRVFYDKWQNKKKYHPLTGQLEFTYRCNLRCLHCYCQGAQDQSKELNTSIWKQILSNLQKEGCLYLTLTGGEPFVREDFLELYSYAKKKCFIVTIFTNGQHLTPEILGYLAKSPPFSIEITLNGISKETYESITGIEGSFCKVMETIAKLKEKRLPLVLKSNCLKQNKDEITKIKAFADKFLGRKKNRFYFKYDPMIYPRLNGDKASVFYRLSFREILKARKEDPDIWREFLNNINKDFPDPERARNFLYHCSAWRKQFFINPYGRLKFCNFSEKFSSDLKVTTFKEGFYKVFPLLLDKKFKTGSKCKECRLRPICYFCPARAYLETGDEESPVPHYCALAQETARWKKQLPGHQ